MDDIETLKTALKVMHRRAQKAESEVKRLTKLVSAPQSWGSAGRMKEAAERTSMALTIEAAHMREMVKRKV